MTGRLNCKLGFKNFNDLKNNNLKNNMLQKSINQLRVYKNSFVKLY